MFRHLLIATDGSELATKGVNAGLRLAQTLNAKVTVVAVTEPRTHLVPEDASLADQYDAARATAAQRVLAQATEDAGKLNVACETVHVRNEFPAEGILQEAKARGCDLIVMASHGRRGLQRILLGGEAVRVLTGSAVPVLIVR